MNWLKEQFLGKGEIKDYKKSHILIVSKRESILKLFWLFSLCVINIWLEDNLIIWLEAGIEKVIYSFQQGLIQQKIAWSDRGMRAWAHGEGTLKAIQSEPGLITHSRSMQWSHPTTGPCNGVTPPHAYRAEHSKLSPSWFQKLCYHPAET